MWIKSTESSGATSCFEAEYFDEELVKVRDSKDPETTERFLRVEDYAAFLVGLQKDKFNYEQNYLDFNSSGIKLEMENGGITMSYSSHESWSQGSLWFNRAEWNALVQGVQKGELTIPELLKDKLKEQEV
jgi:hypothetical protein